MSYQSLGLSWQDLVQKTGAAVGTPSAVAATNVVADPYFREFTCQVLRLSNIADGKPAGTCARTPAGLPGGIGLSDAIGPLRLFVAHKQRPLVAPLLAAGAAGLLLAVGYSLGKKRRR